MLICSQSKVRKVSSLHRGSFLWRRRAQGILGFPRIEKIPCARDAVLHGAGGSVAAGLVHFLATSRVKRSCDVGMAGFVLTTLGSWFYCRYNNAKLRSQQKMIQDGIKNKVMYEGTNLDPTRKARDP